MRVAIHQPEYFPVPRLLAKWAAADLLVVLDDAQFDRASLQHRARLRDGSGGDRWLTIPYTHAGGPQAIRDLRGSDPAWTCAHAARVRAWYPASPRRDDVAAFLDSLGGPVADIVWHAARTSMHWLATHAGVEAPSVLASSFVLLDGPVDSRETLAGSERLVALCCAAGADTYLCGASAARGYLDFTAFRRAGVRVEVQDREDPPGEAGLSGLHYYLLGGPQGLRERVLR